MGLQDVFFKMGVPFDSPALRVSRRISEEITNALARRVGRSQRAHAAFAEPERRLATSSSISGVSSLPTPSGGRCGRARTAWPSQLALIAIAPTATIA